MERDAGRRLARNRSELWGRALVDELVRAGLRELVVSPGSRSTPVVLAAAAHAELRMVVQTDERSAAFLALGVGKATGRPAGVVTTSGTAAANLLPAVVEAAQAETPLLLLTADRPSHLRGADANQAIDQERLFGRYPRFYHELEAGEPTAPRLRHLRVVVDRAVAAAAGAPAGPAHLNLPFAKPLEPTPVAGHVSPTLAEEDPVAVGGRARGAPLTRVHRSLGWPAPEALASLDDALRRARRPLLVAGPLPRPWEVGPHLRRFAAARGIPLLADALSGARYPAPGEAGPAAAPVVGSYDLALRAGEVRDALRPDLVVRFGSAPTSAALQAWLAELAAVPQVVLDDGLRWKDHLAVASEVIPADPVLVLTALPGGDDSVEADWARRWRRVEEAVRREAAGAADGALARAAEAGFEGGAAAALLRSLAPEDLLFVSSSMPVREVDAFAPCRDGPLLALGSRGASGIDGITSQAAGAALGSGRRVVALVGDLALLHDASGLSVLRERGIRVLIVALNNDGGAIFHFLPVREHEPEFTRYFGTPHGRDLSRLAALYDLPFRRLDLRSPAAGGAEDEGPPALGGALEWALGLEGSGLLELRTDRDENAARRAAAIQRALRAAVDALDPS